MNDAADDSASHTPLAPPPQDRMPTRFVDQPHPAVIPVDELLNQSELRTQRRSGPGGQHRNKTSSGVFLTHRPTDIVGEATERRSQAQNRAVALSRLRFRIAVEIRSASVIDAPGTDESTANQSVATGDDGELELRGRYVGTRLRINDANVDKPGVLALLLNDLHAAGGQPSLVSGLWKTSTTAVVSLIQSHPPAFGLLNRIRVHHGRRPLK